MSAESAARSASAARAATGPSASPVDSRHAAAGRGWPSACRFGRGHGCRGLACLGLRQPFQGAPAPARLGQRQRAGQRGRRIADPAGRPVERRQPIERVGRLSPPPEPDEGVGPTGQPRLVLGRAGQGQVERAQGVGGPARDQQHPPESHVGRGARWLEVGGLAIGLRRLDEVAPDRRQVPAAQDVAIALELGRGHPADPRIATSSAFWTWSRFSDWSKMRLRGPSITSEVISSPRWAGQAVHDDRVGAGGVEQRGVDLVRRERVAPLLRLGLLAHRGPGVGVDDGRARDRVLAGRA